MTVRRVYEEDYFNEEDAQLAEAKDCKSLIMQQ